jgi:hypothetical protein
VFEAALKARAELAPQIPKARAAVAATTATARKLRGGLMLTRVAAGVFDIGRAVRMRFILEAWRQQQLQEQQRASPVSRRARGAQPQEPDTA